MANDADRHDLLRVVPAAAEILVVVDVAQLRASPWTSDVLGSAAAKDQDARVALRGFDELRDVDQLIMAGLPSSAEMGESLLVMRGRINVERALAAARKRWPSAKTSSFRGQPIVSNGEEAVGFAGGDTFVSGPLTLVRAAIDCAAGKAADVRSTDWVGEARETLAGITRGRRGAPGRAAPAVELAVLVTPEIRERMSREWGEGADLRLIAARLDLRASMDVALAGRTATRQQAADMAARLTDQVRQLRSRRSLEALGLNLILERLRFSARGAHLEGALSVSQDQREAVGEKMKIFAQLMTHAGSSEAKHE